ncbi:immunoglobulin domain-containing protein oig-1-like [Schistocerca americana]|uniref:immunoglobulin domain-containing protein oig-1-like n=1 Tax=Schistocerca americana TaxID=7009 RepID=UPI001F4F6562|nr:immunoglobulin domain-containing protein oig-1-like [Schistocerca americana]
MRLRRGVARWLVIAALVAALLPGAAEAARGGGARVAGGVGGGGGRNQRARGAAGRRVAQRSRVMDEIAYQQNAYYNHKDGARIVKSSHFEQDYMLGRKISFFCMAQGYPRPEITWFKDGVELLDHDYFQVREWTSGNDTVRSKMEIDPAMQRDAGYYECQADNQYSVDSRRFRTDYVVYTF